MKNNYNFNENAVYYTIYDHWKNFMSKLDMSKVIIGISGGIDSTLCAELAMRICRAENVYGISMPCDKQHDMDDVNRVFEHTKIKRLDFNISDAFHSIINGVENNAIEVSNMTKTNLPARLRMATLYAFAQSLNALVINTCNLSESISSYDTLFGDNCGSYAPIQKLTKSEVRKLAKYLDVPNVLVNKTPIDGLQCKTDEENFGYTYEVLDNYVRTGVGDKEIIAKITNRYEHGGKWKMKMITIEGPEFDFPNYVVDA